ncbi:MAG: fibronectin type III domain-containing protein [Clostridia bacterium]|nr:fibronectin type III domain-containing protein [Clostridia bacterium]
MRSLKKILAVYIAIAVLFTSLPGIQGLFSLRVFAAETLTLSVAPKNGGLKITPTSVTLLWNKLTSPSVKDYIIEYRDAQGNLVNGLASPIDQSTFTGEHTVTGLQTDFIYNFKVIARDSLGAEITSASIKAITGTTMEVSNEPQTANQNGLVKEIGKYPRLKFKITKPSEYNGSAVVVSNNAEVDYDIAVSLDPNVMSSTLKSLQVRYSTAGGLNKYIVTRSDLGKGQIRSVAGDVYDNAGAIEFYCDGVDSAENEAIIGTNTNYPDPDTVSDTGFDTDNVSDFSSLTASQVTGVNLKNIYRNPDFTPGTKLYMTVKPFFNDETVSGKVWRVSTQMKSTNEDHKTNPFIYTPIRFSLSKDNTGNIIATIYKIIKYDNTSYKYIVQYNNDKNVPPDFTEYVSSVEVTDKFTQSTDKTITIFIENPDKNNKFNYRVRAQAPNEGEMAYSQPLDFIAAQSSALPPLAEEVQVIKPLTPVSGQVQDNIFNSGLKNIQSAKVKLRWKVTNAQDYKNKNGTDPVEFHFYVSAVQKVETNDTRKELIDRIFGDPTRSKEYSVADREILRVNLNKCTLNGDYFEYEIDGTNLFKYFKADSTVEDLDNDDDYPTYLVPNKIYYVKIKSSKVVVQEDLTSTTLFSDISIPVSVTIPVPGQDTVSSPKNFKVLDNDFAPDKTNFIKLEWEKVVANLGDLQIQDDIYYDLYMGSTLDGNYTLIGSTEPDQNKTIQFSGHLSDSSTVVNATVPGLQPNTLYYFKVKTRVIVDKTNVADPKESLFSQILSVTTKKGDIQKPGDEMNKPRVPDDLKISKDTNGNEILTSNSVKLEWTELETDVKYTLIRTALKIDGSADLTTIAINPENKLLNYFNPPKGSSDAAGAFTYALDPATQKMKFTYTASDLLPNTVYYFSLRAERDIGQAQPLISTWKTIPVTTYLIETPQSLDVVPGHEIGIWWNANSIFTSDDFIVYANGTAVPKGEVFISEDRIDSSNSKFYARVMSLKADTSYTFRVTGSAKNASGTTISFSTDNIDSNNTNCKASITTREPMHQLEVKWKGREGYKFELAIKGENDADYTALSEGSGFTITSKEKPIDLIGQSYMMYYARIPSLKSNTKYYIKVRSISLNPDTQQYDYSKYIGPASTRTEYSKPDYDDQEQENRENANYFDQVKKFKNTLYWIMGTSSSTFKAKVRRDMAENYIKNNSQNVFVLELLDTEGKDRTLSALYVPVAVMEQLAARNTSLVVKVPGAEYNFRPGIIDYANSEEIEEVKDHSSVKEAYIHIEIKKHSKSSTSGPSGATAVSDIHEVEMEAVGMEHSDAEIEKTIKDKIDYYIEQGLQDLKNTGDSRKDTPQELQSVIEDIVQDVEEKYRDFIEDYIEGGGSYSSIIEDTEDFKSFAIPVSVRMSVDPSVKGAKTGYAYTSSSWNKVPSTQTAAGSAVSFDFIKPGKVAVFCVDITSLYNIPFNHWAKNEISSFASKYDISDVFNQYTGFDNNLSVYNTILVLEKVLNGSSGGSNLQDKAKKLGLDGIITYGAPGRGVTRQEAAALIIRVYEQKAGISLSSLKTSKTILINDNADIKNSYFKSVELCIDMKILSLDENKNFKPRETCSGAQFIAALTRLLTKLGEL